MTVKIVNKITPKKARKTHIIEFSKSLLDDKVKIDEMRENILNNDGYIVKNYLDPKLADDIVDYLKSIAKGSLPAWYPLQENCPDFHRVNNFDPRSYVKACMHQFMFHPWNDNVFDFFSIMKDLYLLKNQLSGLEAESFLNNTPKDGHIARLSFQFYPAGGGMLKRHSDPVGKHQLSVPVLLLNDKSKDYKQGGGYVVGEDDQIIDVDSQMSKGDVVFFNAEVMHGVQPIDPAEDMKWLDFKGRWMMIASVIKTVADSETPNAIQLEE